jgi:probable HAF family extracellular repeat protein
MCYERSLRFSSMTIAVVCLALAFASSTVAQTYTVTNIGTLGGNDSVALSINDLGEVVGYSKTADGEVHAFRYFRDAIFDLSTLGGKESYAYVITNSGILLGDSKTPDGILRPFIGAPNSPLLNFGDDPHLFISARGANNAGQVVGFKLVTDEHGQFHKRAYLYTTNRTIDLGTFGGKQSDAIAINDAGEVVGHLYTQYHDGEKRAVIYHAGKVVEIGTFGGNVSIAVAINISGQVVGYAGLPGGDQRAFLFAHGKMKNLGTLPGGTQSFAYGIDDRGRVVGASDAKDSPLRAFIYSDSVMQDLNKLIPADSGWLLTEAKAINDSGQIVGYGFLDGERRAFLLTPVKTNGAVKTIAKR